MKRKKLYIVNIWGEKEECTITEEYNDGTVRVHIPKYNSKGFYNGYEEDTIHKNELIIEE